MPYDGYFIDNEMQQTKICQLGNDQLTCYVFELVPSPETWDRKLFSISPISQYLFSLKLNFGKSDGNIEITGQSNYSEENSYFFQSTTVHKM